MDELKIFWTKTARKQRDHIFEYWNSRNKSKQYSRKLNLLIGEQLELLKNNPEMGKATDFKSTRVIFMHHYSIFYKTRHPELIVTGFWDNRRDPKKLLKFLKEN